MGAWKKIQWRISSLQQVATFNVLGSKQAEKYLLRRINKSNLTAAFEMLFHEMF